MRQHRFLRVLARQLADAFFAPRDAYIVPFEIVSGGTVYSVRVIDLAQP